MELFFNGIGQLNVLVSKGGATTDIKWLVTDMDDQVRNDKPSPSPKDMQDYKGQPSWPEKSLYRMAILKHLREAWLEVKTISVELKALLRNCTESHKAWRKRLGYETDEARRE